MCKFTAGEPLPRSNDQQGTCQEGEQPKKRTPRQHGHLRASSPIRVAPSVPGLQRATHSACKLLSNLGPSACERPVGFVLPKISNCSTNREQSASQQGPQ